MPFPLETGYSKNELNAWRLEKEMQDFFSLVLETGKYDRGNLRIPNLKRWDFKVHDVDTTALALAERRAQIGIAGFIAVIVCKQYTLLRFLRLSIGTGQDIKRQQEQGQYGCG